MSRNGLIALTVGLCVISAGVGAFFAMQARTAHAPVSVVAAPSQVAPASGPTPVPGPTPETHASSSVPAAPANTAASPATSAPAATPAPLTTAAVALPATPTRSVGRGTPAPWSSTKPAAVPADPVVTRDVPTSDTGAAPSAVGESPTAPPVVEVPAQAQPVEPQSEPAPIYEEVLVAADSVLGLRIESTVNSETARIEDPVSATVTRDVRAGSLVAIPIGSRVLGSVTQLERGGKVKSRARLGVRFHTLVLADGARLPIHTDAIFREGGDPKQGAAAKVGAAAAGGAILGAILGGGKGAAIGGSIGAAGGAAATMSGDRKPAVLQAGTPVTVRLLRAVTIPVER
jgi:type IV secretory pathway VirB10-like protein